MLPREFYLRDVHTVALAMLGKKLVHRTGGGVASGVIVEVEAYGGAADKGAHSYGNRRTARTEIQFGPGGYAYTYLIYGMYTCFNVVVNREGVPEVVLVRALAPAEGIELMEKRRGHCPEAQLCAGPGRLCAALDIGRAQYGADLCGEELYLEEGWGVDPGDVLVSPRINIAYAGESRDLPWRYYLKDCPFVSKVPKSYVGRPLRDAAE